MTPKEYQEAIELTQLKNEEVCVSLTEQFKTKFPTGKCFAIADGTNIRVDLVFALNDPSFNEAAKLYQELEENISYPEIRFIIRQVGSSE